MEIVGDYQKDGFALIRNLIAPDVARAFLQALKHDLGDGPVRLSGVDAYPNLLRRAAFEVYGHHYKPMLFFLWGLTPVVSGIVDRDLAPTYDYLRIYREGDICRVHSDRPSCEHSVSLTLDYSDGVPWPLEVANGAMPAPSARVDDTFGAEPYETLEMEVGDAVIYRGVHHRHGRVTPNPNQWSAHLFMHWVERDGAFGDHAFDGHGNPVPVDFRFS